MNPTQWATLPARDRLIVALDVPTAAEARSLAQALKGAAKYVKVGKQLFTAAGPDLVRELVAGGIEIFLDLKFHDIPNTVGEAVRSAAALGVSMLTVHASGGTKMLREAATAAAESAKPPLILAVTVLTSLSDEDLTQIGVTGRVLDQVLRLAGLAQNAGCGGIVASAREAKELRRELGSELAIVTPGIRPASTSLDDQARAVTPADALRGGATHLVVGRPIIRAADPATAAQAILQEAEAALRNS